MASEEDDVYTITTGSGNDSITSSKDGADQLTGGDGNDTFNINTTGNSDILDLKQGDVFIIDKGANDTDIAVKSDFTASQAVINNDPGTTKLTVTPETGSPDGFDIDMTSATGDYGYTLVGSVNGETLTGSKKTDILQGNAGADKLSGGTAGDDDLTGGTEMTPSPFAQLVMS